MFCGVDNKVCCTQAWAGFEQNVVLRISVSDGRGYGQSSYAPINVGASLTPGRTRDGLVKVEPACIVGDITWGPQRCEEVSGTRIRSWKELSATMSFKDRIDHHSAPYSTAIRPFGLKKHKPTTLVQVKAIYRTVRDGSILACEYSTSYACHSSPCRVTIIGYLVASVV